MASGRVPNTNNTFFTLSVPPSLPFAGWETSRRPLYSVFLTSRAYVYRAKLTVSEKNMKK